MFENGQNCYVGSTGYLTACLGKVKFAWS